MVAQPSARDQNEIIRSASEASKIVIKPVDVARYMNPPSNTPFPLEYAFYLLGDIRGKTVLDLGCGSGDELIPLLHRGAKLIGIDISPDLVAIAERRLNEAGSIIVLTFG
jgi:SAM-dependent methyltransferase